MNIPKISVIVPVYNASLHLRRCIDSIVKQTFSDFEVLLIDDGSSDDSGAVCDDYASRDRRLRVFHKENGGVSSARNLGLENASGDWVTFVDADDEIAPAFLYNLMTEISDKADLIISNCIVIENDEEHSSHARVEDEVISGEQLLNRLLKGDNIRNEVWGKLFRQSFIGSERFASDIKIGEDLYFLISCCYKHLESQICFRSFTDYRYYRYCSSAMGRKADRSCEYEKLIERTTSLLQGYNRKDAIARFVMNQVWTILDRYCLKKFNMPCKYDVLIAEHLKNANFEAKKKVVLTLYLRCKFLGLLSYFVYKIINKVFR